MAEGIRFVSLKRGIDPRRFSLVPLGAGYADLRVYRGGYPTAHGLVIHRDLLPAVLQGLAEVAASA